eukprot:SAG11_NODE_581_length_8363_cov_13.931873_6_plen_62_part_00
MPRSAVGSESEATIVRREELKTEGGGLQRKAPAIAAVGGDGLRDELRREHPGEPRSGLRAR